MNSCVDRKPDAAAQPVPSNSQAHSWQRLPYQDNEQIVTAVLTISGMPRKLRASVETAMHSCVGSPSYFIVPGDDPLTAQWCTRWHKDSVDEMALLAAGQAAEVAPVGIGCHQVLTGTRQEFTALKTEIAALGEQFGFQAFLKIHTEI